MVEFWIPSAMVFGYQMGAGNDRYTALFPGLDSTGGPEHPHDSFWLPFSSSLTLKSLILDDFTTLLKHFTSSKPRMLR